MTYMKFTILVDSFLAIITLYLVCLIMINALESRKQLFFYRNNAFSLYDLYGHALEQEPLTYSRKLNMH